tara:strand:+ start:108 stop:227 length:120 start_codon:yes stop_codon:yes gene_type:complete
MLKIQKNKHTTQLCKNLVQLKEIKKWEKLEQLMKVVMLF